MVKSSKIGANDQKVAKINLIRSSDQHSNIMPTIIRINSDYFLTFWVAFSNALKFEVTSGRMKFVLLCITTIPLASLMSCPIFDEKELDAAKERHYPPTAPYQTDTTTVRNKNITFNGRDF